MKLQLLFLSALLYGSIMQINAGSYDIAIAYENSKATTQYIGKEESSVVLHEAKRHIQKNEKYIVVLGMLAGMQTASQTDEERLLKIEKDHATLMELHKAVRECNRLEIVKLLKSFLNTIDIENEAMKIAETINSTYESGYVTMQECKTQAVSNALQKLLNRRNRHGKNTWDYANNTGNTDILELLATFNPKN